MCLCVFVCVCCARCRLIVFISCFPIQLKCQQEKKLHWRSRFFSIHFGENVNYWLVCQIFDKVCFREFCRAIPTFICFHERKSEIDFVYTVWTHLRFDFCTLLWSMTAWIGYNYWLANRWMQWSSQENYTIKAFDVKTKQFLFRTIFNAYMHTENGRKNFNWKIRVVHFTLFFSCSLPHIALFHSAVLNLV